MADPDYAALADQARKSTPVDYAALADQARGSAPTFATTNEKDAEGNAVVESGPMRALSGVGDTLLPSKTLNDYNFFDTTGGAGYAVRHPIDSAGLMLSAIVDAHRDQAKKTASAYDRLSKATTVEDKLAAAADLFQHAAGTVVPLVGPAVSNAVDTAKTDPWRGGGQLLGLAAPALAGKAVGAIVPDATQIAEATDRAATEKMADVISPKVGREKLRFGQMAQDVAPTLARDPATAAVSRAGLAAKVETQLDAARQALDDAHDARNPATARYDTQPLVDQLTAARDKLVAQPVEGSQVTPKTVTKPSAVLGPDGQPVTTTTQQAVPLGTPQVAPQDLPAYRALSTAIDQVKGLGEVATYDALRKLRAGYDVGAQKIYTPSITQDFLTARGEGLGWSQAAGGVRDFLAAKDPTTAAANAKYALWRRASDVLQATEETERARPMRLTKTILSSSGSGVGAAIGGYAGGAEGATLGAVVGGVLGPAVEAARASGVTTQIATSRLLAQLSDALRASNRNVALSTLKQLAQTTGQTARFDALIKAARAGVLLPAPAVATSPIAAPATTGQR